VIRLVIDAGVNVIVPSVTRATVFDVNDVDPLSGEVETAAKLAWTFASVGIVPPAIISRK
jgi:hypothetical protein